MLFERTLWWNMRSMTSLIHHNKYHKGSALHIEPQGFQDV